MQQQGQLMQQQGQLMQQGQLQIQQHGQLQLQQGQLMQRGQQQSQADQLARAMQALQLSRQQQQQQLQLQLQLQLQQQQPRGCVSVLLRPAFPSLCPYQSHPCGAATTYPALPFACATPCSARCMARRMLPPRLSQPLTCQPNRWPCDATLAYSPPALPPQNPSNLENPTH
jgi:hypothetical protein